jgi:hypothetical protein
MRHPLYDPNIIPLIEKFLYYENFDCDISRSFPFTYYSGYKCEYRTNENTCPNCKPWHHFCHNCMVLANNKGLNVVYVPVSCICDKYDKPNCTCGWDFFLKRILLREFIIQQQKLFFI